MFSRFESAVKLAALFLFLGLCGWIWVQSQYIVKLKAENQTQILQIEAQKQQIAQLNADIEKKEQQILLERETVKKQVALEQTERNKTDEDIKVITRVIYKERCAAVRMPDDVINRLRQPTVANQS